MGINTKWNGDPEFELAQIRYSFSNDQYSRKCVCDISTFFTEPKFSKKILALSVEPDIIGSASTVTDN